MAFEDGGGREKYLEKIMTNCDLLVLDGRGDGRYSASAVIEAVYAVKISQVLFPFGDELSMFGLGDVADLHSYLGFVDGLLFEFAGRVRAVRGDEASGARNFTEEGDCRGGRHVFVESALENEDVTVRSGSVRDELWKVGVA